MRKRIPVYDLNFSAFLHMHGNTPELLLQGKRVSFMFKSDDAFYNYSERYNNNETVNVLDYVNAIRQLRAMMLSLRGQQ
jgi:hypothetical protein